MKGLVFGGGGQLGRALSVTKPKGWDCVALHRTDCDMMNEQSIRSAIARHRPDIVINAAAYTAVDRAESEQSLATAINATAVGIMSDEVRQQGRRLVHVSTDFVFDGKSSAAYLPSDSCRPLSAYGRSKAAGEAAAGPEALIVRTSWVYAAGGANFVRTMLRLMREREEVRVVADQIGAPTWATGLAQTLWALASRGVRGILHHRDAGVASWYDFAVAIQEEALALGLLERQVPIIPITTADFPTPAKRPAFSLLNDAETRAILGDCQGHWRANLRLMLSEEMNRG